MFFIIIFDKGCEYVCNTKSNFKTHLTRYHPDKNPKDLKSVENVSESYFDYSHDFHKPMETEDTTTYPAKINKLENFYMKLYLKLKDKYLIQKYKCNEIFEDINSIIEMNNKNVIELIRSCKENYSQNTDITRILEDHLNGNTIFEQVHRANKKDSVKNKWLENTGFYVPPKQINLSEADSFQYISIIDSIKV